MRCWIVPLLLASIALPTTSAAEPPGAVNVKIAQGRLRGVAESGLAIFRGIPFAGAPIGEWRWRPPQPAPSWRGVRDASTLGPSCIQRVLPAFPPEDLDGRPMQEDCLYLNVWSPNAKRNAHLPVMVWILPGGFQQGDGGMARYDGSALAKRGVVVVTFNYRLGIFGEFAHPALSRVQKGEPLGNYHLMDQIAALRWVRANIAAFGGDPRNATIFGMSAGGISVNYLMASPASAGLFDKAISQSSGMRMSWDRMLDRDLPGLPSLETEGARHVKDLGIAGDDATIVAGLRALTAEQIIAYQREHQIGAAGGLTPVIDGRIVVEPTGKAFAAGRAHRVPLMIGATNWEGSLTVGAKSIAPVLDILHLTREQVDGVYRDPDEAKLVPIVYSDFFFASQRYLAKQHAATGGRAFVYLFSRVLDEHQHDYPGAAHGAETRYVFGTLDGLPKVAGPEHPGQMGWRVNDKDRAYSDIVARYWVQFAKTGDPNSPGLPPWPAVSPGNDLLLEFAQDAPAARRNFSLGPWKMFESHFDSGAL